LWEPSQQDSLGSFLCLCHNSSPSSTCTSMHPFSYERQALLR
jgi:hypothetical protein